MNYIGEALQFLNEEYISENAVNTPSSITIDGKSYPIKSKEFLDGKLAGAGRGFGLEHVLNVKYKGHSYKIYDTGFSNMSSKDRCAILDESCITDEQQKPEDSDEYSDSVLSNFNSENLDEGIFDKIKSSFGRKPDSCDDWKQCLDKGYITWDQIYAANKKAEARKRKEWKENGSNMTYQDYKNASRGL